MRPYRGLTKDDKWVYGWLIRVFGRYYIYDDTTKDSWEGEWAGEGTTHELLTQLIGFIEVIPETVGQQIGRKDKNGVEIYEGDKLRFENKPPFASLLCEVVFDEDVAAFAIQNYNSSIHTFFYELPDVDYEVIGNIHQEIKE